MNLFFKLTPLILCDHSSQKLAMNARSNKKKLLEKQSIQSLSERRQILKGFSTSFSHASLAAEDDTIFLQLLHNTLRLQPNTGAESIRFSSGQNLAKFVPFPTLSFKAVKISETVRYFLRYSIFVFFNR